ncbi:MAG: SdpI family protein [Pseudomonadota bacterium]|nr:SdpI family protein [Pseudomonadota bacterium]
MIKKGAAVSGVLIAVMAAISLYGFAAIPEGMMIARHWNLSGAADGFSPRNHVLIGTPVLAALLSLLFMAIPSIDPRRDNVRRSSGLFLGAWIGAVTLLALIHALIVLAAAANGEPDPRIIVTAVAALFLVLGNFMAKSRSSWFIGLRTPWTLSSEHAWMAANRASGWLFALTGLVALAAAWLFDAKLGFYALFAGAVASAAVGVSVSYFAWRADPERPR